ncbi:Pro-Pol polyprotein [Thelohanellus kitauei]|uniref:Pro-Pol polyprotein n=1 Tax=Thelohanellus kitauei TaxID=669202 RepID=A0A0C2N4E7_THEKT|nr:Pro-Pol polyprotein [Thelohanellus kitauei]
MFGHRIVIPDTLIQDTLLKLHDGHPGINAMKSTAKLYVWWPNVLIDVENYIKTCHSCQKHRPQDPDTPLYCWNVPDQPWERLHIDFTGPFDQRFWFVIVDSFSKWLEVHPVDSANTSNVIRLLDSTFSRFGVPSTVVSDNGSCFTSDEFRRFCRKFQIKHILTTPYHSRSNGAVERVIRTFKARYKAERDSCEDVHECLNRVLFSLRNTIHMSTRRIPSELLLGRKLKGIFENIRPDLRRTMHEAQLTQKLYHDQPCREKSFERNNAVWIYDHKTKQYVPGTISNKTGPLSYIVEVEGGYQRKHADHLRERIDATPATQSKEFIIPVEEKLCEQLNSREPVNPDFVENTIQNEI